MDLRKKTLKQYGRTWKNYALGNVFLPLSPSPLASLLLLGLSGVRKKCNNTNQHLWWTYCSNMFKYKTCSNFKLNSKKTKPHNKNWLKHCWIICSHMFTWLRLPSPSWRKVLPPPVIHTVLAHEVLARCMVWCLCQGLEKKRFLLNFWETNYIVDAKKYSLQTVCIRFLWHLLSMYVYVFVFEVFLHQLHPINLFPGRAAPKTLVNTSDILRLFLILENFLGWTKAGKRIGKSKTGRVALSFPDC